MMNKLNTLSVKKKINVASLMAVVSITDVITLCEPLSLSAQKEQKVLRAQGDGGGVENTVPLG